MSIKSKTILKDKFWILEDNGVRIGTISLADENRFMFSGSKGTTYFDSKKALKSTFGDNVLFNDITSQKEDLVEAEKDVHGYPTSTVPYNTMLDVQQKLPLFTKSKKSKSLYCAGYYIIHFDKGWVKSFCPKLITVERYETKGPFKSELEMRTALSKANAK
ncbi:hypothetical protein N9D61_09860 [Planktomarina sp.]|jgi:hypothetical protein|nr:hypothetical protein [Planktomarina sp.]